MIANHIHDALAQVKKLRNLVLVKRMFFGYSGRPVTGRPVCFDQPRYGHPGGGLLDSRDRIPDSPLRRDRP